MRPQAISFHFNDHNVHDHARLCRGLGEIARAGFRTVLGYRRGTSLLIDDPEFVAAVAAGAAPRPQPRAGTVKIIGSPRRVTAPSFTVTGSPPHRFPYVPSARPVATVP